MMYSVLNTANRGSCERGHESHSSIDREIVLSKQSISMLFLDGLTVDTYTFQPVALRDDPMGVTKSY